MIKIPTKMSLFPGDEICVIELDGKEFKNYLFRNEIEILKNVRESRNYFTTIRIRQRRTDWKKHYQSLIRKSERYGGRYRTQRKTLTESGIRFDFRKG
jgi:hypothetical protein